MEDTMATLDEHIGNLLRIMGEWQTESVPQAVNWLTSTETNLKWHIQHSDLRRISEARQEVRRAQAQLEHVFACWSKSYEKMGAYILEEIAKDRQNDDLLLIF
jgi:hypothetical protein